MIFVISIGVLILIIIFMISNRYIHREKIYKTRIKQLILNKEFTLASESANKLIKLNPKNPEYYFLLAEIYQKMQMIQQSIKIYEEMIQKQVFSPEIREYNIREKLALINLNQHNIKEAFIEFYNIAYLNPDSASTLSILGQIYGSQQKYNKAEELLKKVIELKPEDAEAHYQLGLLAMDTGDLPAGITMLETAYRLDPTHLKCQYFLALAYQQKGSGEKAKKLFDKLDFKDISQLPKNIIRVGLMRQNFPKFDIDPIDEKLNNEVGAINIKAKVKKGPAKPLITIEDIILSGPDFFHSTVLNIINKMGYTVKEEVKTELMDSSSEINFIVVLKKVRDSETGKKYFLQFAKAKSEIGTIPFANFLSKMNQVKARNGIFITTSHFASSLFDEAKKEKGDIILIDAEKLKRYL